MKKSKLSSKIKQWEDRTTNQNESSEEQLPPLRANHHPSNCDQISQHPTVGHQKGASTTESIQMNKPTTKHVLTRSSVSCNDLHSLKRKYDRNGNLIAGDSTTVQVPQIPPRRANIKARTDNNKPTSLDLVKKKEEEELREIEKNLEKIRLITRQSVAYKRMAVLKRKTIASGQASNNELNEIRRLQAQLHAQEKNQILQLQQQQAERDRWLRTEITRQRMMEEKQRSATVIRATPATPRPSSPTSTYSTASSPSNNGNKPQQSKFPSLLKRTLSDVATGVRDILSEIEYSESPASKYLREQSSKCDEDYSDEFWYGADQGY